MESSNILSPVVSVLGHVDHGKTTLLDKIRETSVASSEHGGITQRVGASTVELAHEGKKRRITFIDTPGHEAFANMRSQGVGSSDIVILIVSAVDGVMPQTRESIEKIKEANLPFIVVFTKIDLAEKTTLARIKQQVIKEGIALEGLGGNTPYIEVSAATGEKITELLDLILLVYDLSGIKKDATGDFMAVVIDSKLDKKKGILCSLVIKQGTVTIGMDIFAHGIKIGRVRSIINTFGHLVEQAIPGDACEILGLSEVVVAGTVLFDREIEPAIAPAANIQKIQPTDIMSFLKDEPKDFVPIILKTETSSEMEAIKNSLPEKIRVIYEAQGEVGVADVLMAKDFKALVIGFNVGIIPEAKHIILQDKIFFKSYGIIYEMIDDLSQLVVAVSSKPSERELGKATVLATFMGTTGAIIGVKVLEGRLAVGDRVKLFRGEKELGVTKISSIKKGKEDAKIAEKNSECGIMIEPSIDFAVGDAIIAYSKPGN